jgi:hypothetical protein
MTPNLMPFQDQPFNGDNYVCQEFLKLKEIYNINVAVETGSCLYSTTSWLGDNFKRVYSVEINQEFAKHGVHKVSHKSDVHVFINDSIKWIESILPNHINTEDQCIYFLDAHWGDHCPLLEEILHISKISQKPPIIVIHDFYTGDPSLGYDTYKNQPFTWDWIKPSVDIVEENFGVKYLHYFNTQAEGAKRGLVYIIPNQ